MLDGARFEEEGRDGKWWNNWRRTYGSSKEFSFFARLISTCATYSAGNVRLKYLYDGNLEAIVVDKVERSA